MIDWSRLLRSRNCDEVMLCTGWFVGCEMGEKNEREGVRGWKRETSLRKVPSEVGSET